MVENLLSGASRGVYFVRLSKLLDNPFLFLFSSSARIFVSIDYVAKELLKLCWTLTGIFFYHDLLGRM